MTPELIAILISAALAGFGEHILRLAIPRMVALRTRYHLRCGKRHLDSSHEEWIQYVRTPVEEAWLRRQGIKPLRPGRRGGGRA